MKRFPKTTQSRGARNTPANPFLGEELLGSQPRGGTNDKCPTSPIVTSLIERVSTVEVDCRGEASTLAMSGACSDFSWHVAGEGAPSGACSLSPHTILEGSFALPYFSRGDDGSYGANTWVEDHVARLPNDPLPALVDNSLGGDIQFSLRWESDVNNFLRSFDTTKVVAEPVGMALGTSSTLATFEGVRVPSKNTW